MTSSLDLSQLRYRDPRAAEALALALWEHLRTTDPAMYEALRPEVKDPQKPKPAARKRTPREHAAKAQPTRRTKPKSIALA